MIHRRALLRALGAASAVLAVAACGYKPMYGGGARNSSVARELAAINVGIVPDRIGQLMRAWIEQQVAAAGRGVPKVYDLEFATDLSTTEIGIAEDATATRANVIYSVTYRLKREGQPVLVRTARSITSYNILDDQYAAVISKEAAEERAAEDVAWQIVNGLSAWFAEQEGM